MPGLGFVAKPGCDIGYRSDGGIIEASLKADGAERGKSVRNPDAKANVMPKFAPLLGRRALDALPPILSRNLIASPRAQGKAS